MQENGSALIPEEYREATTQRFSPVKRTAITQFALPTLVAGLLLTGCKVRDKFTKIKSFLWNFEQ